MGEYMRTLLNGLKAWVGGEINKLRAKIEAVATAASKTASLAAKNKTDIAELNQDTDEAYQKANAAQTTANEANALANTALQTANGAASVASTAKSTADTAKSAADTAKSTVDALGNHYAAKYAIIKEIKKANNPRFDGIFINGGRLSEDSAENFEYRTSITFGSNYKEVINMYEVVNMRCQFDPKRGASERAQLIFSGHRVLSTFATDGVEISGLSAIILDSSNANSTKKFRITVNDTGTLTTTEVTS